MFNLKLSSPTELEVVRTNLIAELEKKAGDTEEYKQMMHHVETLSKLIDATKREKLSPNTVAIIAGNLGIAGLVLWFERENVLTTKLFPFLAKPKS